MAAYILFTYFGVWPDYVKVTEVGLSDLCSCFYHVSISYMWVEEVAFDSKDVVVPYFHHVVFFWGGFEHDDCSFFDDIEISKDDFEVFVFFLADDRTGGVDDAALAEDDIADYFVEA